MELTHLLLVHTRSKKKYKKELPDCSNLRCMGRDSVTETEAFGSAMLKRLDSFVLASDAAEQHQSHCLGMWRSLNKIMVDPKHFDAPPELCHLIPTPVPMLRDHKSLDAGAG